MLLVADMHELTLIHTDLKPENILLVSSEYVKVPDYKVCEYTESTSDVETVNQSALVFISAFWV